MSILITSESSIATFAVLELSPLKGSNSEKLTGQNPNLCFFCLDTRMMNVCMFLTRVTGNAICQHGLLDLRCKWCADWEHQRSIWIEFNQKV